MGYCWSSIDKFSKNGWRVGYIDNSVTHLISAGATECMCTSSDGTASDDSCSSDLDSTDLYKHFNNMDNISLKYCNKDYAKGGVCNNTTVWAMSAIDYEKITGVVIENSSDYAGLINNGGFYWYATRINETSNKVFLWFPSEFFIFNATSSTPYGVRPVLALDPSVRITGGIGTYEDPYTISKD